MPEWRSVDHVQEATKEWKVPREPVPPALAREASVGGRYAPHRVQPGEQFGELTAIDVVDHLPNGTKIWACKCSCGGEALRSSGQLTHSVRDGRRPCCARCVAEQRGGQQAVRSAALREAYRKQYVDYRTLWLPQQSRALVVRVWNDLVEAFGQPPEEEGDPDLPLQQANGWPYSVADYRYALQHHDFGEDGADVPEPAERYESAIDRRERELAADLAAAIESGDQEQIDDAVSENAAYDAERAKEAERVRRRLVAEVIEEAQRAAVMYRGLRVCQCAWCAQRIAWKPGTDPQACSPPCARRYADWVKRERARIQIQERDAVWRKADENDAKRRADKERKEQDRLEQVRIARERDVLAKIQPQVLVPIDGVVIGRLVENLQKQLAAKHNVQAYYVKASFARGHTVLEFKMTNRNDQALHIILNGSGPGRAAWVIGAASADEAAGRVIGRPYSPSAGIPTVRT